MIRAPGLSLLVKELTERSARRRTYALRVAAGLLLLVPVWLFLRVADLGNRFSDGGWDERVLMGRGDQLIQMLVGFLALSIALVLPAMVAGIIANERERGTLALLMLTPQRPTWLLLQFWITGILPAVLMILLAAPLLALAFAYGGVQNTTVGWSLAGLLIGAAEGGAIALASSAWARGPGAALVWAYVLLTGLWVGTSVIAESHNPWGNTESWWHMFVPIDPSGRTTTDLSYIRIGVAALIAAVALFIARLGMFRRLEAQRGLGPMMRAFRWLDALAHRTDARWFGRTTASDLPITRPIRWRELNRRGLASARYLVRWFLPALAAVCFLSLSANDYPMAGLALPLLPCLLLVAAIGGGLFASERSAETLPVLLTTPIPARTILRDKIAGLQRIVIALAVLVTIPVATKLWIANHDSWLLPIAHLVRAPLALLIALWLGVLAGLLARKRATGTASAILLIVVAWGGSYLITGMLHDRFTAMSFGHRISLALLPGSLETQIIAEYDRALAFPVWSVGQSFDRSFTVSAHIIFALITQSLLILALRFLALHLAPSRLPRIAA